MVVKKYNVPGHCEGRIRQVLNVNVEYEKPVVWILFDETLPYRSLDFYSIGTDWQLGEDDNATLRQSAYIGTVKDSEKIAYHCFCIATEPEHPPVEENKEKSAATVDASVETSDEEVSG